MRFLADENFPKLVVDALRAQGHDVLWVRTDCPGWKDLALLELAETEARIILTLDKDFLQLAIQRRRPIENAGLVLFRVHPATPDRVRIAVNSFLMSERGWSGHISIITPGGIQMMPTGRRV